MLGQEASLPDLKQLPGVKPRNVIYIIIDDMRHDAMGFLGHPFLKTPNIDSLAAGGVYFENAFVTTSLCSPSRASVLTGRYMHNHGVVDNNAQPPGLIFFPQYLQKAGYDTAFIGKWHMGGDSDDPRPGFDHWVSFKGQGHYLPPTPDYTINVDGARVKQKGYITDELTDYAIDWLDQKEKADDGKPFFLYLGHKAVHADFTPAERHKDLFEDVEVVLPGTFPEEQNADSPLWVQNQRNSWHGGDFPYHSDLDVREYYKQYCRALVGVDESLGRVLGWLRENGELENTLVLFMGDNGFLFGEHGLIDKRNAYETSMRVPLLAHCPELFEAATKVEGMVANIDIAPSILDAAGLEAPADMDGRSFVRLATGELASSDWRQELLYEYYWEYNFPHTPTMFALRTDKFKFIQYHGVWDTDELYDLEADPDENHNLIFQESFQKQIADYRKRLHAILEEGGATQVPFTIKRNMGASLRREGGSEAADFPAEFMRKKNAQE